jgi:hypothetical protein
MRSFHFFIDSLHSLLSVMLNNCDYNRKQKLPETRMLKIKFFAGNLFAHQVSYGPLLVHEKLTFETCVHLIVSCIVL